MSDASSHPRGRAFSATDDKMWATVAHFGGVLWFVPSLVVYLLTRGRQSRARQESKEALNWQITFTAVYAVVMGVEAAIAAVLLLTPVAVMLPVLAVLPTALYIANAVLSIRAGLRVNADGSFRYPLSIRLIR
ncbi:DUF4870 domain-containing protein [Conyzicola sp.]|uniref:DUF4870 domain-containing protein n=1 Tax=Conyzicola sp. TaxID=1969404 RepID=UPI003988B6E1